MKKKKIDLYTFYNILKMLHDIKIKTRAYKGNDKGILTHVPAKLFIRERRSNF